MVAIPKDAEAGKEETELPIEFDTAKCLALEREHPVSGSLRVMAEKWATLSKGPTAEATNALADEFAEWEADFRALKIPMDRRQGLATLQILLGLYKPVIQALDAIMRKLRSALRTRQGVDEFYAHVICKVLDHLHAVASGFASDFVGPKFEAAWDQTFAESKQREVKWAELAQQLGSEEAAVHQVDLDMAQARIQLMREQLGTMIQNQMKPNLSDPSENQSGDKPRPSST